MVQEGGISMEWMPDIKSARMLALYSRLVNGETLDKKPTAEEYHVSVRSIQRDMEVLRYFIAEQGLPQEIVYCQEPRGYRLIRTQPQGFSNDEILAVCKILLESRSMRRDEMMPILDKLIY